MPLRYLGDKANKSARVKAGVGFESNIKKGNSGGLGDILYPIETALGVQPIISAVVSDSAVYPGQSYILSVVSALGVTVGRVFWELLDGSNPVEHTVTNWGNLAGDITVTAVRGKHKYGNNKYRARILLGDGVTEIILNNGGFGLSLEPEPGAFAITAINPNIEDNASLWKGLINTVTGLLTDAIDGYQMLVRNPNGLLNLQVGSSGVIESDETGTFTIEVVSETEDDWSEEQEVAFEEPDPNSPLPCVDIEIGIRQVFPDIAELRLLDNDLDRVTMDIVGVTKTTGLFSECLVEFDGVQKRIFVWGCGRGVKPFYKINWQILD